jgi:DnaJ-domain-containing protein 1
MNTELMSDNPYDILGVSPAASRDEIYKAYKTAMKEKKRHPKVLMEARKKLLEAIVDSKPKSERQNTVIEHPVIISTYPVVHGLTVSRNYCLALPQDSRYVLIQKGEELPVKRGIIIETEADGQRLIHFKFFSPDEIKNESENRYIDEPIGQMWLALDKHYPKGTEIILTAEIAEKNEAVQMTAHLGNDESVKVSCAFGRGGEDGRVLEDRKRVACEKLIKELRIFSSEDYDLAYFFISCFEFAINHCHPIIPQEQQVRLKTIVANLENAIEKDNLANLIKYVEDARQDNQNLPNLVSLVLLCRAGINQALKINPTAANVMTDKFARMLYALEHEDMQEVDELLQQLLPEAKKYSNQVPGKNFKVLMGASISQASFSIQDELNSSNPLPLIQYNAMSNNPYDILGVSPAASNEEINKAFNTAMAKKKSHPKVLTGARTKLKNNEDRLVADYLLPALPPILRFKRYDLSSLDKPTPELELIKEFSNESLDDFHAKVMADFNKSITNLFQIEP